MANRAGSRITKVCVGLAACLAAGCAPAPDDTVETDQEILGDCSLEVAVAPEGRQLDVDAPVDVVARGVCLDGSAPEFRTSVLTPTSRKLVLCDWQAGATCSWTASGLGGGSFLFTVDARRPGDETLAATKNFYYAIGGVCTSASVTASPANPSPGEPVTLTAHAECDPSVTPEYSFSVTQPGGATVALGRPQTSPQISWDTTGVSAGFATLRLKVRPLGNRVYDVTTSAPFSIGDACTASSVAVSSKGPERTVTASASCTGDATPEYHFSVFSPDGTETLLRDFGPEPITSWNTTGLEGTHRVRAVVRAVENPNQLVSFRDRNVVLANACNSVALRPPASPVPVGTRLELGASAPCTDGEYAFQVRASTAAAWLTVCPYSSSSSCAWRIPAELTAGSYAARALVRKLGSQAPQDAVSPVQPFVVEPGVVSALRLQDLVGDRFMNTPPLLSGDGSTVVLSTASAEAELFRWSEVDGIAKLPPDIWVNDVSFDGSVLVGGGNFLLFQQAIRWTREFGVEGLGTFPGLLPFSQALSVSSDGERVLGESSTLLGIAAFEWTPATRFNELIPPLFEDGRVAVGSADARVVLTRSADFSRWVRSSPDTRDQELAMPEGALGISPAALSNDGRIAVGSASTDLVTFAVSWNEAGVPTNLADVPVKVSVGNSFALTASADGSRVFGGLDDEAFVWDPSRGLRRLTVAYPLIVDALGAEEVPLFVSDASADGTVLIVFAQAKDGSTSSYYRVVLPPSAAAALK